METPNYTVNTKQADQAILRRLLGGDEKFARVFFGESLRGMLGRINRDIFHNKMESGDLASLFMAFLSADNWAKLRSFRGDSSLARWLYVVARREFYAHRHDYYPGLPKPKRPLPLHSMFDFSRADSSQVDYILSRMENPGYAQFIRLRHISCLGEDEIREQMCLPVKKMESFSNKAYRRLLATIVNAGEMYEQLFLVSSCSSHPGGDTITDDKKTVTKADILIAMSKLSEEERRLVQAHVLEDKQRYLVAEEMGISKESFDKIRNRAFDKLRKHLWFYQINPYQIYQHDENIDG